MGMAPDVAAAKKRYAVEKTRWDQWVPVWQECYDYALPNKTPFHGQGSISPGQRRNQSIYDLTAAIGTQEFASRLLAGTMPSFARWADLQPGTAVPEGRRAELEQRLDEITEEVFQVIRRSNFDTVAHEAFLDLAVGTGCWMVERDPRNYETPVTFTAIPLTDFVLGSGPYGGTDAYFRHRRMRWAQIEIAFPEAKLSEQARQRIQGNPNQEVLVVQATVRDWTKADEAWNYCAYIDETGDKLAGGSYKGRGSNPWVVFRWSRSAGEVYGRGPLMMALPTIKTVNYLTSLTLENAEMAIAGMWQVDDSGVVNHDNIVIEPGALIPRAPGTTGMEPLVPGSRFDVSNLILENLKYEIKRALYDEALGSPQGTPMSATEVTERMADLSRRIGSPYARIINEAVYPTIKRVVRILIDIGRIRMPQLDGREVTVSTTSPLSKAQNYEDVRNVQMWMQDMVATFGPEMGAIVSRPEQVARYTGRKLGVPEELIRSPEEAAAIVQQAAQMGQQGPGGGQT